MGFQAPADEIDSSSGPTGGFKAPKDEIVNENSNSSSQNSNDYWTDVKQNAAQGVKGFLPGMAGLGKSIWSIGTGSNPVNVARSMQQVYDGTPFAETPLGQSAQNTKDLAVGMAKGVGQTLADTGKLAVMPGEMAYGTPPSQTMFGKSFRDRPISSVFGPVSLLYPAAKSMLSGTAKTAAVDGASEAAATEGAAGENAAAQTQAGTQPATPTQQQEVPGYMQMRGSANLNAMAGIKGGTINRMTPMAENPGIKASEVANLLDKEGVTGATATDILSKAVPRSNFWGQQFGNALDAVKKANSSMGTYPELEDSLKVDATPTLKPILDEANDLVKSGYDPKTGTLMHKMYDNLASSAEANNGFLTLDNVRTEMQRVGKMFKNYPRESEPFTQAATLYGQLHDIQDSMVNDIASRVSDPTLASNLKNSAKMYSTYQRLIPDMRAAAAGEGVGAVRMTGLFDAIKHRFLEGPELNSAMMKTGKLFRKD